MSGLGGVIGQYSYDGDGRRMKKTASAGDNVVFVYDAAGKLVEERNASTSALQTSYVYAGSRLRSTETSLPDLSFSFESVRIFSKRSCSRCDTSSLAFASFRISA